jgi:UPF0271 protein
MNNYVLDTCAFISGLNTTYKGKFYSVPSVIKELPLTSMARLRLLTSMESGHLKIISSSRKYHDEVVKTSKELGEIGALSKTDLQLVALALELETKGLDPIIITDDYAIQNIAEHLNISYSSLATLGITYEFIWKIYCSACYKVYEQDCKSVLCQICGTRLKRKVISKQARRS